MNEEHVEDHPDLHFLDPTGLEWKDKDTTGSHLFRSTELVSDETISEKILKLDKEQRMVIDVGVDYAKKYIQAEKKRISRPKAQLVIAHGGASTGKSMVIDVLSQALEKIFRKPGDDPNHPYIIRAAFTGNASLIIKGQTLQTF